MFELRVLVYQGTKLDHQLVHLFFLGIHHPPHLVKLLRQIFIPSVVASLSLLSQLLFFLLQGLPQLFYLGLKAILGIQHRLLPLGPLDLKVPHLLLYSFLLLGQHSSDLLHLILFLPCLLSCFILFFLGNNEFTLHACEDPYLFLLGSLEVPKCSIPLIGDVVHVLLDHTQLLGQLMGSLGGLILPILAVLLEGLQFGLCGGEVGFETRFGTCALLRRLLKVLHLFGLLQEGLDHLLDILFPRPDRFLAFLNLLIQAANFSSEPSNILIWK